MNKPTQISIKYTAGGVVAFLIGVLIFKFIFDSSGTVPAGVAVGVFTGMLFASTRAAYEQGKKDALADSQLKHYPS